MTIRNRTMLSILGAGLALTLAGCQDSSGGSDNGTTEPVTYAINGNLSGLGPNDLTLDFNGEEILVSEDGEFQLAEQINEGSDFSITVTEAPSSPFQECTPSPASGTVTSNLTVDVVCTTPVKVVGKLTAPDAEGTQATLTIDGIAFTGTADTDGVYTIEADLDNPWAVMRLDAGEGDWHFRSQLGSIAGLAGDSAIPSEDERNQLIETVTGRVNLNHLNTAISGQMEWLHGGSDFADHEALVAAGRDLLTQQAAEIAGALRMVTEGAVALPEWADNTHQVAVDHLAARRWIAELNADDQAFAKAAGQDTAPELQDIASGALRSGNDELDSHIKAAISEATVESGGYTQLPEQIFVTAGYEFSARTYGAKLDLLAGQVWMREIRGRRARGAFNFADGELHMNFEDYEEPYFTREFTCEDDESDDWARCTEEHYYQDIKIQQVMDGLAGDVVTQEATTLIEITGEYAGPNETNTVQRLVSLMAPGDNIPLDVDELPGKIALAFPPDSFTVEPEDQVDWFFSQDMNQMADIVSLDAGGTGSLQHYDMPIYWDVRNDGQLEIRIDGRDDIYQFWMLSGEADGEGHVFIDSTHSNQAGILTDIGLRKDETIFFNSAALEGRWELWSDEERDGPPFAFDYNPTSNAGIVHIGSTDTREDMPDHEADLIENNPHLLTFNGSPRTPVFVSAKCRVYDDEAGSYETVPAPAIGLPDDPENPECNNQYRERTWQIIRQDGDRLYMTEKQRWYFSLERDDGEGGTEPFWHRVLENDTIRYWKRIGDSEI